jgi:hypothetical protein
MINTASQYPFSGTTADLTRTHQGWGLPDVRNLYDARNNLFVIDESDRLTNLQRTTYRLFVPSGQPAFRATMVYTDPPGTTSASQHRINDLSLKVTAPDGTIYFGNNGLLAGNWSTAGGSPDTKNVVENVFVQNPQTGVWIVEVSADQINADAELTTGAMDADYALVASGVLAEAGPTSFSLIAANLAGGGLAELQTSNNARLQMARTLLSGPTLEVTSTAPTVPLEMLSLRLESSSPTVGASADVYFYNYRTLQFDLIGSTPIGTGDQAVTVGTTANTSDYVDPSSRQIKAQIRCTTNARSFRSMSVNVDQVRWVFGV